MRMHKFHFKAKIFKKKTSIPEAAKNGPLGWGCRIEAAHLGGMMVRTTGKSRQHPEDFPGGPPP